VYTNKPDGIMLYNEYLDGKQTLGQLSDKYKVSVRTIQRKLSQVVQCELVISSNAVVIMADASYWGRDFGVIVFKDAYSRRVIWYKFIYRKERVSDYLEGIDCLIMNGYAIRGIVCDGMSGLIRALSQFNVQYCQFHMVKTVHQKLTKHPKSEAGRELLHIANLMTRTDKESFVGIMGQWYERYGKYMNERSEPDLKGHTHYLHKRLRSAYFSIIRNMEQLWTWYDNFELKIPNTNNGIESLFTDMKSKLRVHNGLSLKNREKFISQYLKRKQ